MRYLRIAIGFEDTEFLGFLALILSLPGCEKKIFEFLNA